MWLELYLQKRTAYEMSNSDWSSDVCSSNLLPDQRRNLDGAAVGEELGEVAAHRPRFGRVGGAQVDQQHAAVGRGGHSGCAERGRRWMRRLVAVTGPLAVAAASTGTPLSPSPPGYTSPPTNSSTLTWVCDTSTETRQKRSHPDGTPQPY